MRRILVALTIASIASPLAAQTTTARQVFHKRFFVSYQTSSHTDVPVSYAYTGPNSAPGALEKLDGTDGMALGLGFSVLGANDKLLFQVAYDRSSAKYSSWVAQDRTIAFNSVDLVFGYATRGKIAFVPFITIAPGWYNQSDYNDPRDFNFNDPEHKDFYEAMSGTDYTMSGAAGLKIGFLRYFAATGEYRFYKQDVGSGGGCSANVCYYEVGGPKPKSFGTRTSVGLQIYFGGFKR